ncbi:MAG TPA: hypothetical protein VMR34_05135 [Candidatus Saccharimonadales bacterium]|nr:hypothetical protein [Candidatus Saccharimonadales bacterium]
MDPKQNDDSDSLENEEPEQKAPDQPQPENVPQTSTEPRNKSEPAPKKEKTKDKSNRRGIFKRIFDFVRRLDIYILIFALILMVGLITTVLAIQRNQSSKKTGNIASQNLNQSTLSQLNSNDTNVGGTQQTLDVQSDTIFNGTVLVKNSLNVAGQLKIGGSLNLPGITVAGTTDLDQVSANSLVINGAETIKGTLTVNGGASFGGSVSVPQLDVSNLQLTGDIVITHHITVASGLPVDSGSGLGSGGTTTITGGDTAGTVNINTGSGSGSGCMSNITFSQSYATVPHVVISPASYDAASTSYYVSASKTGFSVCFSSGPGDGKSMAFAYVTID